MRTWAKALTDHRCSYCGLHIRAGDVMEILELEGVKAKRNFCREHARTAIPLAVPDLPTEMELYTIGDMERIKRSRERMIRIGELGKSFDWKTKSANDSEGQG